MVRTIEILGLTGLAVGALLSLLALVARLTPRPRVFCPGPLVRGPRRFSPTRLLRRTTCNYDLSGLPGVGAPTPSSVTCPECGRTINAPSQLVRKRSAWRWSLIGPLLVALSLPFAFVERLYVNMGWAKAAPTDVLLVLERGLGGWSPRGTRTQLLKRHRQGELSERQRLSLIDAAITDLRSDTSRHNAVWAIGRIIDDLALAPPALERALISADRQQRQIAADLLRLYWHETRRERPWLLKQPLPPYEAPASLFSVTLEGLADDPLPFDPGPPTRSTYVSNAFSGVIFLVEAGEPSVPYVERGLTSADRQTRFLCAVAAGYLEMTDAAPLSAPTLTPHLRTNTISGDARVAARALLGLGESARPFLEPLLTSGDPQAASAAAYLLLLLDDPAKAASDRASLRLLTRNFDDLREITIDRARQGLDLPNITDWPDPD